MIKYDAFMQLLNKHRGDAIVIPTMTASGEWLNVSEKPSRDVSVAGAMGKASSFGLGLALSQPDTKVVVVDGDGSLNMNTGALLTVAGKHPKNFYHLVMNNGVFAITGGQPVAGDESSDYAAMAKGAGYTATYTFDDIEEFAARADEVFGQEGPVLVNIKAEPIVQNEPIGRRTRNPRARPTSTAIQDLRKELGTV